MLGDPLSEIRDAAVAFDAKQRFIDVARAHQVFPMVQEDPYTHRAFTKPRGYAGDAPMLDFIYQGKPPQHATERGKAIFKSTTRGPMGLSIIHRRAILQSYINDTVARREDCRILSVASGHCRELEGSLLLTDETGSEFVALDQDEESCDFVASHYPSDAVKVLPVSIKRLIAGGLDLGRFDLIYSAGLFDYLTGPIARKLTARLFSMLNPYGRLVIGNFNDQSHGRGYMESLMDWHLIYRSEGAVKTLFPAIERPDIRIFTRRTVPFWQSIRIRPRRRTN